MKKEDGITSVVSSLALSYLEKTLDRGGDVTIPSLGLVLRKNIEGEVECLQNDRTNDTE